jgi:hypothetical protein
MGGQIAVTQTPMDIGYRVSRAALQAFQLFYPVTTLAFFHDFSMLYSYAWHIHSKEKPL